jgi:hypothetical protein
MMTKEDLQDWVIEALKAHNGKAKLLDVCKYIWTHYETQLRASERFLYTW